MPSDGGRGGVEAEVIRIVECLTEQLEAAEEEMNHGPVGRAWYQIGLVTGALLSLVGFVAGDWIPLLAGLCCLIVMLWGLRTHEYPNEAREAVENAE